MKKYTIEITEDAKGTHITKTNNGFNIFELTCFVGLIYDELTNILHEGFELEDIKTKCDGKKVTKKSKVIKK